MTVLNAISWLFALLMLIVCCNRYIFGSIAGLPDRRTEKDSSEAHGFLTSFSALGYELNERKLRESAQTSGLWFLTISIVFPVLCITLALLELATPGCTPCKTRRQGKKLPFNAVAA
jgi:apolipoprotein N-acyltransferase